MTSYTCTDGYFKGDTFINIDSDNTLDDMVLMMTLLHIYFKYKNKYDLIKVLLRNGISPNFIWRTKLHNGEIHEETPLTLYLQDNPSLTTVELLVEYGANTKVSIRSENNEWNCSKALDFSLEFKEKDNIRTYFSSF